MRQLKARCICLFKEERVIAVEEDVENDQRQNIRCIEADPFREAYALTGVGLGDKVIPAPAIAARAEAKVDKASQRQQVVADEEVLQVKHAGALAERLEAAPDVEAENAGQRQQNNSDDAKADGFLALPAGQVADAGGDVLEHGDNGGHSCKEHEEEEERAPDAAAAHSVEHIGQRDEEQVRAGVRLNAEAEAGREDNQAGNNRYEGVQRHDIHCFTSQALLLADVAAEDSERTDAQAQREEGLAHSSEDNLAYAMLHNLIEIRIEIILQTSITAGQHDGVDCQHQHEHEQAGHHRFRDALYAVFYAQIAYAEAGEDNGNHVTGHRHRIAQQCAEDAADALGIQTDEAAHSHFIEVIQHPAADGGIEHHEDDVAGDGAIFIKMPFRSLRLQHIEGFGSAAHAGTANCELCYHDGQAQQQQKAQIDKHKGSTAVLTCDEGEAPYVSQTDSAARRNKDKAYT